MIGLDRQRQMFAAQFQPDGVGFIYRNHTIGEPIRITAAQRERYVTAFEKFSRNGFRLMIGGAVMLLAAFLIYSNVTKSEVPDAVSWSAFGVMVIAYMVGYFRAWNFPARDLRRRR